MSDFNDLLQNAHGPIRYRLTNDYMFRAVLQNSPEALKHLLSALLSIPYTTISSCEITNPIILGETIQDKDCILDIRLCINNNQLINLEMQTGNFTYWSNRALFYLSRMFCSLKVREDYSKLKPATHIGILTQSPFSDTKSFYSEYYMINPKNGHIFSRNFSARVLDLSQIHQVPESERQTELYYWAKFFLATTWEEVVALSNLNPYLTDAASHLRKLSDEEKIQQQCEMREKYAMDMSCQKNEGIEQGIEIGLELINKLNLYLTQQKRLDDLTRSITDREYQKQLLKEFHLL